MTENNTQEVKKAGLTLGQKIIFSIGTAWFAFIGYSLYQKPLIHLRPYSKQEVKRTTSGVEINREEYERFESGLGGTRFEVMYSENANFRKESQISLYVFRKNTREGYYDDDNDGKVDSVIINGFSFYRDNNGEFENKIDPKFAAYKQRLNADEVIAEKMKETAPTIEDLLGK